jgi:hypothetical protein
MGFQATPGESRKTTSREVHDEGPTSEMLDLVAAFNTGFGMQDARGGFHLDGQTKGQLRDRAGNPTATRHHSGGPDQRPPDPRCRTWGHGTLTVASTAFADNLVPHVLRLDGVLTYDDELVARIHTGELLTAGSPEEVEIRALGVHAVERLRTALAELGHDVPSWLLDQVLWERGGGATYKAVPRHRARSVFY